MGKILKLGFAMGGGVSLGSFSGGALTEAIKLLVLYGKDADGNRYEDVEIDVFSGASAGSMSLSIMLRALADQTNEQREKATQILNDDFGSDFHDLSTKNKDKLIAAQVAQDVQKSIWVDEINLNKLLGKVENQKQKNLNNLASILDRGALEDISKKYFDMSKLFSDPDFKFENKQLLTERVLFASTLTNLTKIQYDARPEFSKDYPMNNLGLEDGLTSNGHKDLRIFDLNFTDIVNVDELKNPKSYPPRWCRYHLGGESEGNIGDLKKQSTWSKIIATSIACGAFPFAFEPVVLNRAKYEFGHNIWPNRLSEKDINWYPFTYVDGGALNNEPIREAYRLASFMDANDPRDNTDRLIVFVDPNVNEPQPYFNVPIHNEYKVEDPRIFGDGYDLERLNSIDRMIPQIGSMISVLMDQAKVIEKDKIYQVRQKIDERDNFRSYLKKTCIPSAPKNATFNEIGTAIKEKLENNKIHMAIPPGALSIQNELKRVIKEEYNSESHLISKVNDFVISTKKEAELDADKWIFMYYCVLLDLTMDMTGKSKASKIIAIAPVVFDENRVAKIIDLPGKPLSAFAGFTSSLPSRYEVKISKYCARLFLEEEGFIIKKHGGLGPYPIFTSNDDDIYKKELKAGVEDLSVRISEMIKKSHLLNTTPGLEKAILYFISNKVKKIMRELSFDEDPKVKFIFKIEVPSKKYELDGKRPNSDFGPVKIDGKYYLITNLDYHLHLDIPNDTRWKGIHTIDGNQKLFIDLNKLLKDKGFCTIQLPNKEMVAKARLMPNPTFLASISKEDKGMDLVESRWDINVGVVSLEETII